MKPISKEELAEILQKHEKWATCKGDGIRANLLGADLSWADLSRANLSRANLRGANLLGADLSWADLSRANLSRANLRGANLLGADLSWADLSRANLSRANLLGADLSWADLSGADLSGADLSGADLLGANLSRANLSRANLLGANLSRANLLGANLSRANLSRANLLGTCLDQNLVQLQRQFCRQCPPLATGGRIVFRTSTSQHVGSTNYTPGRTYTAPNLSFDCATDCHPGIYAASREWMEKEYPNVPLVVCYVRDGDWVISAKGAIRCKKLRVLRYLD